MVTRSEEELAKIVGIIRVALTDDIIERYDNPEYWNEDLIYEIMDEYDLDDEEKEKVLEMLYGGRKC